MKNKASSLMMIALCAVLVACGNSQYFKISGSPTIIQYSWNVPMSCPRTAHERVFKLGDKLHWKAFCFHKSLRRV